MTKTLLLTGYEPFDRFSDNPSGIIARQLDGQELGKGYIVRGAILPVDSQKMPGVLSELWDKYQPSICVGLGLAFGENSLRLERIGHNWIEIGSPDNGGHTPCGSIVPDGPAAYFSPLPLKMVIQSLLERGIPANLSDHAGTHLCNMLLYLALHRAGQLGQDGPKSGFIHLPAHPELAAKMALPEPDGGTNKLGKPGPSMSLDLMQKGVLAALRLII